MYKEKKTALENAKVRLNGPYPQTICVLPPVPAYPHKLRLFDSIEAAYEAGTAIDADESDDDDDTPSSVIVAYYRLEKMVRVRKDVKTTYIQKEIR